MMGDWLKKWAEVRRQWRLASRVISALLVLLSTANGAEANAKGLRCDDSIKQMFKPDGQTVVLKVKAFAAGDVLALESKPKRDTPRASTELCMVKLNVGPGNPGPNGAPSTSPGIGIEVWLPAATYWNGRIHAIGGGGWQGGGAGAADQVSNPAAAGIAAGEGAVTSTTDTGHSVMNGSFAMTIKGGVNSTLWKDFAIRSVHEQAVKTKLLTAAYYGRPAKWSYWEGGSTGGRQGLSLAQEHPEDFDGIVANYPAINWTRFITAELYPQIVYQRDLGGKPLSKAQLDLVSRAAIAACDQVGGEHLGYIRDPAACTYDPSKDAAVLCASPASTDVVCVNPVQAIAVNKIWYGMTRDGSVPDPATDNGWPKSWSAKAFDSDAHRWFGLSRGTTLYTEWLLGLASPDGPFPIATDVVALELGDATLAGPTFTNAQGDGQSRWTRLDYDALSDAYDRGIALQDQFGRINSDDSDLTEFKRRGGKLLTWHGLADEVIMAQGTVNYYNRVAAALGGLDKVQDFYRLYLVPGLGHGSPNGTANRDALIPNFGQSQMYDLIVAWVERGIVPEAITLESSRDNRHVSGLVCHYPLISRYTSGDPRSASSYRCTP
jgi:feruloyl esterase